MASRNKILKQADRLAQRGNPADAATTLLKLVKENPRDVALLNKAGDLFVRAGQIDQAVQQFETIARFYKDDGFLLKAIAIYTKISKLDPSRIETYLQLGELYAERGLRREAKQNLMRAAEGFSARGNKDAARRALETLEKLDPDDPAVHGKLVDLLEEGGDSGEAASRHLEAARKQVENGQLEAGLATLEKALAAPPNDPVVLAGMAELLLQAGNAGRAAELLDRALPGIEEPDLDFLLMIGRSKRESGDVDGAKTHLGEALKLDYGNDRCHVEMALCYLAGSDTGRAFEQCRHVFNRPAESKSSDLCLIFLEQFLETEPFHLHALRELAILHRDSDDEEAYLQVLSRLASACHQAGCHREELFFLSQLAAGASGDAAVALENRRKEAEQLAAGQDGALDESLIDFLPQDGEESLPGEADIAEAPDEELVFEEPPATAANGTDRVVLGAEEDRNEARESEIELIIEDERFEDLPEDETGETDIVVIEEVEADPVTVPPEPDAGTAQAAEPAADQALPEGEENDIREQLTATRVFLSYGMLNKAMGQMEELLDRFPGRGDVCELAARIYQAQGRDAEAEEMRARAAELSPEPQQPEVTEPDPGGWGRASWMNGDEAGKTPAPQDLVDEAPAEAAVETAEAGPDLSDTAPDPLSEDLEEVDFFISQGFTAEARDLIQGLLQTYPDHARLREMLEQVGGADVEAEPIRPAAPVSGKTAAPPPPRPEPASRPTAKPEEVKAGAAAGTPLDDEQLSEVFSMFQEEVAGQVDEEDFGTHYDLGIAYKEMSLVDEAIGEFQIAARSAEKRLDCCCMLGACFMEKGMPGEAIKWYEKGISTAETGSEETKGLQYDLAAAMEADGATEKALEIFQALAAVDEQYRDVSIRIQRLQSS